MKHIYLSPHLDDAALSCGGIIRDQVRSGDAVEVWTFFTADPPASPLSGFAAELHERWQGGQEAVRLRREEDETAMRVLGCSWQHLGFHDCIYRVDPLTSKPLIHDLGDLFSPDYQVETALLIRLEEELQHRLSGSARLYVPLSVGEHVDHRLVRMAAERLARPLVYYADFPYAAQEPDQLKRKVPPGALPLEVHLSQTALKTWQQAIACYKSQISSFWSSIEDMKKAIVDYARQPVSTTLWQIKKSSGSIHGQT